MNKNRLIILSVVFCLVFASIVFNFASANAQNTQNSSRQRQVPTPTPTDDDEPPPPLPVVEDGPIIIKSEVVNLNVRVIDRNNRPINSLSQNDFRILEDNIAQPIEFFAKEEVPTNYSLVIDNSGSMRFQLEKVIEAGKIIVGTNRPDDETSIIRFVSRDKISIERDFTPEKEELNDALDNLYVEGGKTAIIDAVYLAAERVENYESNTANDRKRRALILVSDGEDRNSFYKEEQLYELLRESDVQIYAIGFVNELDKESSFISKSPQGKAKAFLERLAKETGGKVYFPNSLNELNGIAQDIASELRTQYSLGYVPTNKQNDGTYRNIKVSVADGPNNQKRIAVTRSGRKAIKTDSVPTFQNPVKTSKAQ